MWNLTCFYFIINNWSVDALCSVTFCTWIAWNSAPKLNALPQFICRYGYRRFWRKFRTARNSTSETCSCTSHQLWSFAYCSRGRSKAACNRRSQTKFCCKVCLGYLKDKFQTLTNRFQLICIFSLFTFKIKWKVKLKIVISNWISRYKLKLYWSINC